MLKITENNTTYTFPKAQDGGYIYGFVNLVDDWREYDYKNNGQTLDIGVNGYYNIPETMYEDLMGENSQVGFLFDDGILDVLEGQRKTTNAQFNVELSIDYTNTERWFMNKLNALNKTHKGFIETLERDQLGEFSDAVLKSTGLQIPKGLDITLQWRKW